MVQCCQADRKWHMAEKHNSSGWDTHAQPSEKKWVPLPSCTEKNIRNRNAQQQLHPRDGTELKTKHAISNLIWGWRGLLIWSMASRRLCSISFFFFFMCSGEWDLTEWAYLQRTRRYYLVIKREHQEKCFAYVSIITKSICWRPSWIVDHLEVSTGECSNEDYLL